MLQIVSGMDNGDSLIGKEVSGKAEPAPLIAIVAEAQESVIKDLMDSG